MLGAAMSTAPETQPEAAPPTTAKPPFYRRPLVLIVAGAVVLLLIAGGILTAVTLRGNDPAAHLAAGTTSRPTKVTKSTPTPSETPTPTPTPTASVAEPQPQAGAPAKSSGTGAAPVAPVAPVAPAPAPPVNAGPGRSSDAQIIYLTANSLSNCPVNGETPTTTFFVNVAWNSTGGKKWILWDSNDDLHFVSPGLLVGPSGSKLISQRCTAGGGKDTYRLTVEPATVGGKAAVQDVVSTSYFHG
jgi:hypothetical protein